MPVAGCSSPRTMRPSEKAASTLTTIVIPHHTVTIAVFLKDQKIGLRQQQAELISVTPSAMIHGLVFMCATSASLLSEVTTM